MSALLPIPASELNICAEYGYSTRKFSKYPHVCQAVNYNSSMFLVYRQTKALPNRHNGYRNHFCLYINHNSICIVRTETTLLHADNDAILVYDIIKPKLDVKECFRAKYKNWDISFDYITHSNTKPSSFVGFTLVCSGEWWFFDDGIILNGITSYKKDCFCEYFFMYYELHPQKLMYVNSNTNNMNNSNMMNIPPVMMQINDNNNIIDSHSVGSQFQNIPQQQQSLIQQQQQTSSSPSTALNQTIPNTQNLNNNNTTQQTRTLNNNNNNNNNTNIAVDTINPDELQALINETVRQIQPDNNQQQQQQQQQQLAAQQQQQQQNSNTNIQRPINNPNNSHQNVIHNNSMVTNLIPRPLAMASISPRSILPYSNAIDRPIISSNDSQYVPETSFKAVIPSLFWLEERQKELEQSSIQYFLPYS